LTLILYSFFDFGPNGGGQVLKFGRGLHLELARPRQRYGQPGRNSSRPTGHYQDFIGQENCFGDAVGNQENCDWHSVPDSQEFLAHPFAGQGVERTERFVEEQQGWLVD
jgi:hypothetical protein